jgi:hypothetical protein
MIGTAPGEGEKGKGGKGVRVARVARGTEIQGFYGGSEDVLF